MSRYKNIIGQKFGRLTILDDYSIYKYNKSIRIVRCKCECGNIKDIYKEKVLRGATKSCGCLREECKKQLGLKRKKEKGEASFNELYSGYKKSANRRGYQFNLSKEDFKNIITKPCIYCGKVLTQEKRAKGNNGTFKYTGIDRYNNNKGYVLNNCVPCCAKCNRLKGTFSIDEFENMLNKIIKRKNMWKRTA